MDRLETIENAVKNVQGYTTYEEFELVKEELDFDEEDKNGFN